MYAVGNCIRPVVLALAFALVALTSLAQGPTRKETSTQPQQPVIFPITPQFAQSQEEAQIRLTPDGNKILVDLVVHLGGISLLTTAELLAANQALRIMTTPDNQSTIAGRLIREESEARQALDEAVSRSRANPEDARLKELVRQRLDVLRNIQHNATVFEARFRLVAPLDAEFKRRGETHPLIDLTQGGLSDAALNPIVPLPSTVQPLPGAVFTPLGQDNGSTPALPFDPSKPLPGEDNVDFFLRIFGTNPGTNATSVAVTPGTVPPIIEEGLEPLRDAVATDLARRQDEDKSGTAQTLATANQPDLAALVESVLAAEANAINALRRGDENVDLFAQDTFDALAVLRQALATVAPGVKAEDLLAERASSNSRFFRGPPAGDNSSAPIPDPKDDRRERGGAAPQAATESAPKRLDLWYLPRIGLTPELHRELVGTASDPTAVRRHLEGLLANPFLQLDFTKLRRYLDADPDLGAGTKALLLGRLRDAEAGRRVAGQRRPPAGAAPFIVAVLDTGIDLTHPQLWGQCWENPGEIPGNGRDDDGNGYADDVQGWNFLDNSPNVQDDSGHGTHVAGLIAARHDGRGVRGVNPNVKLMALKVGDRKNVMHARAWQEAVIYAVRHGAKIIQFSNSFKPATARDREIVQWALSQGVLFVTISHNFGDNIVERSPACLPGVLTVAATDRQDKRAPFSGWGDNVGLAAPGVDMHSLRAAGTDFLIQMTDFDARGRLSKSVLGELWYDADGTSFAAPLVTGVAALVWQRQPRWTAEQVKRALLMSCDDVEDAGWDNKTGAGRLNAARALRTSPDDFLQTRILQVKANADKAQPGLVVFGEALGSQLTQRKLEIAFGKAPPEEAWRAATVADDAVAPGGQLGLLPAALFDRKGVWSIRSSIANSQGATRQALATVTIE